MFKRAATHLINQGRRTTATTLSVHNQFRFASAAAAVPPTTVQTPKIGQPAPDFSNIAVVNGEFKQVSLKDFQGKYFVLFFYPLDFTVCNHCCLL